MSTPVRRAAPVLVSGLLAAVCATFAHTAACRAQPPVAAPDALARLAVDADTTRANTAIVALRALGPAGHRALLAAHAPAIATLRDTPPLATTPEQERLRHAVDVVSGQRDGHASGLYFHTDLAAALREATERRLPVLSLRMLGRLDEELSCANSRYFRTLLYPDEAVARVLRERFVLHVAMERPAPRITIDMGDGRTMVRTITGNSIHYVLDARGRVVDALPGLYAPVQFLAALDAARARVNACERLDGARHAACIVTQHRQGLAELATAWNARRTRDASLMTYDALVRALTDEAVPSVDAPSARLAMGATLSKIAVEAPVLDRIARQPTPRGVDPVDFTVLARPEIRPLGARTLALLRLKTGRADVAALATSLIANATGDGLRNEYVYRRLIHDMLAQDPSITLEALNARVYTELFLTPASDPWLGMRADDVWDAIDRLGMP